MGRSQKLPDPRPSYAQALNYTGLIWHKGSKKESPRWQCRLSGSPTLGEGKLLLGYFRDDRAEYIKAAKAWDRARIALACVRNEPIHLLGPDAKKRGRKLNFARENYQDVIQLLESVEIPKNADAVRALVQAVALEKPLPQPGSPGNSHEAADGDEEVKLQDLITNEKDASDEAEESPLPSVRRAAGQASGRRKRSDTPPEDTPAAKVQKQAPPRTVPASVPAEVQRAQATEELRRDLREAELKLKVESLAEKCAGLEALVAELKRSNAQQQQQQERLVTHLEQFNAFVLEENEELRRLLARADNQ